jgi:hypothetical protein
MIEIPDIAEGNMPRFRDISALPAPRFEETAGK